MINKVILTGRLTDNIGLRKTNDGTSYAFFTLAVNRRNGNNNGTDFIFCTAWRQTAELMQNYLKKGSLIGVEGRLQVFTQNKDGNFVTRTTVNVATITFLETKTQSQDRQNSENNNYSSNENMTFDNDNSFNENTNNNIDEINNKSVADESSTNSNSSSFNNDIDEIDAEDIDLDEIKF